MELLRIIIREIGAIARASRRRYYIFLKPDYVKEQIKKRKGRCGYHGCCNFSILSRIYNIYYRKCVTEENRKRCLSWISLPRECQVYPLDEKDKIPETRGYCNFHW